MGNNPISHTKKRQSQVEKRSNGSSAYTAYTPFANIFKKYLSLEIMYILFFSKLYYMIYLYLFVIDIHKWVEAV